MANNVFHRAHYNKIAALLRVIGDDPDTDMLTWLRTVNAFADMFRRDHPGDPDNDMAFRLDLNKFLIACGLNFQDLERMRRGRN